MGGLVTIALPVLAAIVAYMKGRTGDIARQTGLSEDTVAKVSDVVGGLFSQDSKAAEAVMAEIDKARAHDASMNVNMPPIVNLLRGLVRPVITLTAFFWYVYARSLGVPMAGEDYAIVGGIVAFWFGFRPFEKGAGASTVAQMLPMRGKGATGGAAE